MKIVDIFNYLNDLFPVSDALDFDNVGILVGNPEKTVKTPIQRNPAYYFRPCRQFFCQLRNRRFVACYARARRRKFHRSFETFWNRIGYGNTYFIYPIHHNWIVVFGSRP